ncbi:MAG: glycosyl hydrolase 115 family protein [Chitinophagaceae bacterium]
MIACLHSFRKIMACLLLCCILNSLQAQDMVSVSSSATAGTFPLVAAGKAAPVWIDAAEATSVQLAVKAFQKDVKMVTGITPAMRQQAATPGLLPVIVATIGRSPLADKLQSKLPDIATIKGKWETFVIAVVSNPLPGVKQALCIVGSDNRGTAFGVFEVSAMIGVSPWYWWADVTPERKTALFITPGHSITGPPSVKYRGIFLNDEDWGLQPWAAKKMDTVIKDIGPNTYEHIFELLLRLKANYIWPAMHPCTKAFYYYPQNGKLAADYDIVVGTSHCEPMMRNNVFEWSENYKEEYKTAPKEWRYDLNKEQIYPYWEDRIKQVKDYPVVVTVGMRGIHDGSMPGPKDMPGKVKLLQQVITDQREILSGTLHKNASDIPQIFCPYKEVLDVYRSGIKLPDDITIVWADDNHGYVRQLSNDAEQQRSGGSGVYYHLSYWGRPHDYLWLSTISPSLVSYEMSKAYTFGADRLWVFNVGDLKPAEMEMEFSLDLAWDVNRWKPSQAKEYAVYWAQKVFGKQYAADIAQIKNEFYRLAAAGKPEHLGKVLYTREEAEARIKDYHAIVQQAEALQAKIPARLKDAYFELVLYPAKAASLMNEKVLYARMSLDLAQQGNETALDYSRKAETAFAAIAMLTDVYNKQVAKGKWDGIMSWHPRDQEVFKMPPVADIAMITRFRNNPAEAKQLYFVNETPVLSVEAGNYTAKKDVANATVTVWDGLGIGAKGVGIMPYTALFTDTIVNASKNAFIEYKINLPKGKYRLITKCLPTHDINKEHKLFYAVSVNDSDPQWMKVDEPADTKPWDVNVVYGFIKGETYFTVDNPGESIVRVYPLSGGIVLNQLQFFAEKQ